MTLHMTLSQPHLEEEHKADPLVEGVPDNLLLVVEVRDGAHPGVGNHHAHLLADQLGQGEGGVDPAVGVHDTLRDLTLKSEQYCHPLLTSFGHDSLTSTMQSIGSPKNCPMDTMMQEAKRMRAVTLQWSLNTRLSIHICNQPYQ